MGRWSQEWNRIPDLGVIPHVVAIPEVVALSGIARLRRCALSDFRVVIVILVVAQPAAVSLCGEEVTRHAARTRQGHPKEVTES